MPRGSFVARCLRDAVDQLEPALGSSARRDAELLLAHLLAVPRGRLSVIDDPADEQELARFTAIEASYRAMVKRRAGREPLQYIVGSVPFAGIELLVGQGVLIPRPETEVLVEEVARELSTLLAASGFRASAEPRWIVDVGVGSGAILAALLAREPVFTGLGVDLSREALAYARRNLAGRGRASLVRGDLTSALSPRVGAGTFWIVIANLPYIPRGQLAGLEPEVRDYEPRVALDGGSDGLELVRRLIPDAARLLEPSGILALELAFDQPGHVAQELESSGLFGNVRIYRDWAGKTRGVIARRTAKGR